MTICLRCLLLSGEFNSDSNNDAYISVETICETAVVQLLDVLKVSVCAENENFV